MSAADLSPEGLEAIGAPVHATVPAVMHRMRQAANRALAELRGIPAWQLAELTPRERRHLADELDRLAADVRRAGPMY